jgi:transposase
MGQVAVYSRIERRRRWSDAERWQILDEAFSPGAKVLHVARHHDISTGLIYTWRRKHLAAQLEAAPASSDPGFAEAVLVADVDPVAPCATPAIVIDLERGKRVSIFASASPALAAAALKALR